MTALFTASGPVRHMLAAALFITVILQLFLCLYEQVCRAGRGKRAADRVILLVLTGLCACLMAANNGGVYPGWLFALVPPAAVISLIYALTGMRRAYRIRRDTLSASSVKEALDNLNSGILFYLAGMGIAIRKGTYFGKKYTRIMIPSFIFILFADIFFLIISLFEGGLFRGWLARKEYENP